MADNPLGQQTDYPSHYAPDSLYAIPRRPAADSTNTPAYGLDHWHAYELSWLTCSGLPQVGMAEFFFDLRSPNMVESKSLKLYLNSLNQTVFPTSRALKEALLEDLARCCGFPVEVRIYDLKECFFHPGEAGYQHLDSADIAIVDYSADAIEETRKSLQCSAARAEEAVSEAVYTDLFRSNCPVTGQPDWASVLVRYKGRRIAHEDLLRYLCSYRNHQAYHEQCADQIFADLLQSCSLTSLELSMHFLRRGGLDINCHRSTQPLSPGAVRRRLPRQ